jgi:cell division protein FtsB
MDAQNMLGVLLSTTEQQSQTTDKLLAALQAQIDTLKATTQAAQRAASLVGQSAAGVGATIEKATAAAVGPAVKAALVGATETAKADLDAAVQPILSKLAEVNTVAGQAEGKLRDAVASFGWKWVAVAGGTATISIAAVLLAAWLTVGWQRDKLEQLTTQRQALSDDIAQMRTNVAALQKRGGRIKLSTCGPNDRLCVEVAPDQGSGETDYKGSWNNPTSGMQFVIPRGY